MNDGSDPDFSTTSASGASGPTDLGASGATGSSAATGASGASGPLGGDAPEAATGLNGPSGLTASIGASGPAPVPVNEILPGSIHALAPQVAVMVEPTADGVVTVHGLAADGTQHTITLAENHGALLAFKAAIEDWFQRLGERATSWEKTEPKPVEPPA